VEPFVVSVSGLVAAFLHQRHSCAIYWHGCRPVGPRVLHLLIMTYGTLQPLYLRLSYALGRSSYGLCIMFSTSHGGPKQKRGVVGDERPSPGRAVSVQRSVGPVISFAVFLSSPWRAKSWAVTACFTPTSSALFAAIIWVALRLPHDTWK
jgi:hypothetical protein